MPLLACLCSVLGLATTLAVLPIVPHDPGLSSLRVRRDADQIAVHVAFANADFRAATTFDRNGDGTLDAAELAAAEPLLRDLVRTEFALLAGGEAQSPTFLGAAIAENQDVELSLVFSAPTAESTLRVLFLTRLSRGHRCHAAVSLAADELAHDALLSPRAIDYVIPAAGVAAGTGGTAGAFLWLGIEHILIGFDHLAFLLAVLIGGLSWRAVVATITAFTVAHSLTLLVAALGVVRLPGVLVEATIAGSIVVVAAANLRRATANAHRWPWAFGFGLMHGFGFAGVLADLLGDGRAVPLAPLLMFNAGVELGQLAFAAVVVPLLRLAARHPRGALVAPTVSVLVALAGCWWLLERLLD